MTQTLIVGGGLAGLSVASQLQARGHDYRLIEARPRLGGRISSESVEDEDSRAAFDLGPAWFWPGQVRIATLLDTLQLSSFEQFSTGALCHEDERGRVQRGRGLASMEGSLRVRGGLAAVVDALASTLSPERIATQRRAVKIERVGERLEATVEHPDDTRDVMACDHLVLALPPRLAAARIDFGTLVPESAREAMASIPTWMAGHAKIVAVYRRPFWREAGLSGDASSRRGPMVEIHDASPASGGPFALFGFVGVPPRARVEVDALRAEATAQLVRLFGEAAGNPLRLIVRDWAFEADTATEDDHQPLRQHPRYGFPPALRGLCRGQLWFAGSEVASVFGGYLEGALEAAEAAVQHLEQAGETPRAGG